MASVRTKTIAALLLTGMSFRATADVLYRYEGGSLFDGAYGPVARMQVALQGALSSCGRATIVSSDGRFGAATRAALAELARCPAMADALRTDADARNGALTTAY